MRERGKKGRSPKHDLFHVIHKLPYGDTPYVRAKHAQLVEKDAEGAIAWFREAIRAGDRVGSALKDMAVVMKQLDRAQEAIDAIQSFRSLCSPRSQHSLDNLLIDLYKKCGRTEEQIQLLKRKLRLIYQGQAFDGKPTKTARSHGKKFRVSIKQETARLLGNLGWAYMQKGNYVMAEAVFKKAQMIEADGNRACNLGQCLMRQGRYEEAQCVLEEVVTAAADDKSRQRAHQLMTEMKSTISADAFVQGIDQLLPLWRSHTCTSRRLPIFEQITPLTLTDQLSCS
ncbi:protein SULFUR DEFICIENCY-INDUCED 1-like isoform X1 [Neltuma alba]|uniref:protein SULFUR DEFICIENCY-INDUCED 1-like isoform X1 n=1 Tax=Neltuma alba TaxID=207710 RepID=UPI0010A51EDC|nr:protein SULFUR DEFICIENCY-INDUCED 1-like isoform X1 [Prosopis alba]